MINTLFETSVSAQVVNIARALAMRECGVVPRDCALSHPSPHQVSYPARSLSALPVALQR